MTVELIPAKTYLYALNQNAELRAEIERLTAARDAAMRVHMEDGAEIDRQRAALQEIIAECGGYTLDNEVAFRVGSIARRALEPKP